MAIYKNIISGATYNNNTSFVFNTSDKEVLKITEDGEIQFGDLHFPKPVVDSLLKGKSLLVSRCDEGWYINDTLVPDSDFDSEIVAKVAKASLLNCETPGVDKFIEMIKSQR